MSTQTLERIISTPGNQEKFEVNKNHLRVYGHTLCPFVARARYALALKKIPFQDVQMDLNQKAQWHFDFNGGLVPILETPAGDLIKESGVVAMFAHEEGKDHGVDLFPKDPIEAAKLRVEIENASKYLTPFYATMLSRGEDQEKNKKLAEFIEGFSALLSKANGKFLFGTDEPTMLDVYYAPFLEIVYLW